MWIVPDWIPYGVVTGLYGDGGLGKSLLAQQLQTSTALGRPWLGLSTEKIASLGIYCEDSRDELLRRQAEINVAYGCEDSDDLENRVHWMPRLGEDNLFMTFSGGVGKLTDFHEGVTEAAVRLGVKLVIVDTAADVFGGNENDRGQVRQFISRVWPRQRDFGEPSPDSSALRNALWRIAKETSGDGLAWRQILGVIEK